MNVIIIITIQPINNIITRPRESQNSLKNIIMQEYSTKHKIPSHQILLRS